MGLTLDKRFRIHTKKWNACTACPLHQFACNKALFRGKLRCDILLIGEGPGEFEDARGKPFVGPAGRYLDSVLEDVNEILEEQGVQIPTYGITNIVACMPVDDPEAFESGKKYQVRAPKKKEVVACQSRVDEIVEMSQPKAIVTVGASAKSGVREYDSVEFREHVKHPAAILRIDDEEDKIVPTKDMILRIVKIAKAIRGILPEKKKPRRFS